MKKLFLFTCGLMALTAANAKADWRTAMRDAAQQVGQTLETERQKQQQASAEQPGFLERWKQAFERAKAEQEAMRRGRQADQQKAAEQQAKTPSWWPTAAKPEPKPSTEKAPSLWEQAMQAYEQLKQSGALGTEKQTPQPQQLQAGTSWADLAQTLFGTGTTQQK